MSEGTPVSPPFATEEELIEYLAEKMAAALGYTVQKIEEAKPAVRVEDPLFGEVSEETIRIMDDHFSGGRS